MPRKTIKQSEANLVWIDLEMTGLHVSKHTILEIAVIITDSNLKILYKGTDIVIKQPKKVLDNMNDWCKENHGKSGLIKKVMLFGVKVETAEKKILNIIKKYCVKKKSLLCGNSIHADRVFLEKYMPKITDYLHYRLIDVSTIKELCRRWYPKYADFIKKMKEDKKHRALDDIKKSIEELKFYRENIFIQTD